MTPPPDPLPPPGGAPASWAQVRALFDEAMGLPPADRAGYVRGVTVDEAVRQEVLSLLAHAAEETGQAGTTGLLDRPAAAWALHGDEPVGRADRVGERIGPWAIESLLGRGGMGEVWLARRVDGAFQGAAAIKVLRRGLDSAAVLARFALEQQALARLTHPHIARLLDAGRTADGLPCVVMEHVPGVPISQASEGRSLEERLQLFLQLAEAVAHAHRNLLVHRDLKPSNVLVMPTPGLPGPGHVKLLDFGIAKALDPLEGTDASLTQAGERPFTPHFASPEQVRGEAVSTSTDIYSLGVLLYVMLTGTRPYGREASSAHEAARSVLEEEPTRPSALSPGLVADPQWMATRKRLRGDLDNILLKALDKRIERRYPSVDALAADIRAYLGGHPVSARPASVAYLASRFVRRHRAGVALAALALAGVVAAAGVALWQAQVADAQRQLAQQRFQQVHRMAQQLVFQYHDAIENLPGATAARRTMLTDALAYFDSLGPAAREDPQLAQDLAGAYYRISRLQGLDSSIHVGEHDQAAVNLRKALALSERYAQQADLPYPALSTLISMHVSHGELLQRAGRMAEAEQALLAGAPLVQRALARGPKDTWALSSALTLYGVHARLLGSNLAMATLGRWRAACARADEARAAADLTVASDPANVYAPDTLAFTVGEQAQCRLLSGDAAGAVARFREQQDLRDRMALRFPDDMDFRYQRSIARGHLARALSAQGAHEEARVAHAQALSIAQDAQRADPGNVAALRRLEQLEVLALVLDVEAGRTAAAQVRAAALAPRVQTLSADSFPERRARAEAQLWLARALRVRDPARAAAWAAEAAAAMAPARADDDNVTRRWLQALALGEAALARHQLGEAGEAARLAREALALWRQRPPEEGPPPLLQRWMQPVQALADA